MKRLMEALLRIRVRMCYICQCDPIPGSAHFRTPVEKGEAPDYCPTRVLAPHGEPMTQVLDMDAREAEGWRRQLYAELRADAADPER